MTSPRCLRSLALLCVLLGACTSTPLHDEGGLARAWQKKLSEYNIYTVFPPREDFSVGDLYLLCEPLDASGTSRSDTTAVVRAPLPIYVASVNSAAALETHYATRVSPPPVGTPQALQDGTVPAMPRVSGGLPGPFGKSSGDAGRFRNVSLPEFFTVIARGGNVGALAPTVGTLIGVGLRTDRFESISISVPWGSSYGLPVLDLLKLTMARFPEGGSDRKSIAQLVRDTKNAKDGACPAPRLTLVTEVYFAHSIDVRFEYSKEAAAQVSAAFQLNPYAERKPAFDALKPGFSPLGRAMAATPKEASPDMTSSLPGPVGPANRSAFDGGVSSRLDAGAVIPSDEPGGSAYAYSADSSGITARRFFTNPVAIGYRGVEVKIDTNGTGLSVIAGPGPQTIMPASAIRPAKPADK